MVLVCRSAGHWCRLCLHLATCLANLRELGHAVQSSDPQRASTISWWSPRYNATTTHIRLASHMIGDAWLISTWCSPQSRRVCHSYLPLSLSQVGQPFCLYLNVDPWMPLRFVFPLSSSAIEIKLVIRQSQAYYVPVETSEWNEIYFRWLRYISNPKEEETDA